MYLVQVFILISFVTCYVCAVNVWILNALLSATITSVVLLFVENTLAPPIKVSTLFW